ncbi:RsmD family RNA methyltransferase [Tautonia plasticadhaerens]|uniref:Ribosomal RNA small subunit methyltransferase D n=1 Tax=Tautonia plasticadhaerens TaxID=2527974 RepID=A0A518GXF2_9BACT|nr:RsmD family RNA methyltransferase [Tautonia plasticadhaerens]QDV33265.1 Ribosomal RNA small subunit methyltransferase D [Tautonia plasticadhaerens]
MRIIAGIRRGHTIQGPGGSHRTRPTSDMVRESIFNIIGPEVEGRPVIDLFAGTGALGLEALSRGATSATFVEKKGQNAALIRKNLAHLRFEGLGEVVVANAYAWASQLELPIEDGAVVVFIDPPYRDYEQQAGKLRAMFDSLVGRLPVGSSIVAEAGVEPGPHLLPDLDRWDLRRYGGTHVAIRTLDAPAGEA